MSEERNKDKDVERLKDELKEVIDNRIESNNGFANLLRGDYSLFISLIFLVMSVFGAWKLGFLAQHYVLSVYLVFVIWLLYGIRSTISTPKRREQESVSKLIGTNRERIKVAFNWYFKWARPMIYSLWVLFILCIVVLWIVRDFRWWLLAPAILFALFLPLLAEKGSTFFEAFWDVLSDKLMRIEEKHKTELNTLRRRAFAVVPIMRAIGLIPILAILGFYLYYIARELLFIILRNPYSIFEVILTIFLILISLAFLSEYLSMKFMVTEVSNQIYKLSVLRMGIDKIEDAEALEKKKKELLKWYLPRADSFLIFFNYYGLILTEYTFEVGEEGEEEESS